MLVEVTKASQAKNDGDCKVPSAFRLSALGCSVSVSPSADLCDVEYELVCRSNVQITLQVKQLQDDRIEGTLHKVDLDEESVVEQCVLDLDVVVKNTPAPQREDADE